MAVVFMVRTVASPPFGMSERISATSSTALSPESVEAGIQSLRAHLTHVGSSAELGGRIYGERAFKRVCLMWGHMWGHRPDHSDATHGQVGAVVG